MNFKLTGAELKTIDHHRQGFVVVVTFESWSGRKILPLRTQVCKSRRLAEEAAAVIAGKRYAGGVHAVATTVYAVGPSGRGQAV